MDLHFSLMKIFWKLKHTAIGWKLWKGNKIHCFPLILSQELNDFIMKHVLCHNFFIIATCTSCLFLLFICLIMYTFYVCGAATMLVTRYGNLKWDVGMLTELVECMFLIAQTQPKHGLLAFKDYPKWWNLFISQNRDQSFHFLSVDEKMQQVVVVVWQNSHRRYICISDGTHKQFAYYYWRQDQR